MTEQELIQENEKLTARLKKAVEVFNEQKATISRQTDEIESLKAKAAEAENKDNEFFEQVNEIEKLKDNLAEAQTKCDEQAKRLEKATSEYKKLKDELDTVNQKNEDLLQVEQKLRDKLNKLKKVLDEE